MIDEVREQEIIKHLQEVDSNVSGTISILEHLREECSEEHDEQFEAAIERLRSISEIDEIIDRGEEGQMRIMGEDPE